MNPAETIELRPGYRISRVIRGGWQLASDHTAAPPDEAAAVADLLAAFDAGLTTFDCADIYTGVEAIFGAFRRRLLDTRGAEALARLRIHTKLVPDLARLAGLRRAEVEAIIDRSLIRLGVDRLDLVQFHWWDYDVPGWLEPLHWLDDLRRAGKVLHIGATNFDTAHLQGILEAGLPLLSMQTQYSLLDTRPAAALADVARSHGVALFAYGTVAGGFLSERWLGVPEPETMANRSLTKYRLIIRDFGGWALFQELLQALADVAARHGTDIASIATRWALDRPGVAAAIVGARRGTHAARHAALTHLVLDAADRDRIDAVLARRQGPYGEPFALERDRTAPHGAIMKYNLNKED